ncbi:MAG: ABC transporter ATP-binding protein [Acidimicrobiales bacterium]|jgi:ABC-2 type transport system ATP-binding protein
MLPARSADGPARSPGSRSGSAPLIDPPAADLVTASGDSRVLVSPAIHTIELRKAYRHTVALEALSLTVERGEIFGFLGPNGAGKTTAVKLLLGLAHPTGGEAMVLGSPAGDVETRRRIGYLPELFRFQGWLTAREVLLLHCRLLKLPSSRWAVLAREALSTVGLSERGDDKVAGFSKGMQQRLGLGVALLGDPELVVLDEPTSALDPIGRHHVREIICALRSRGTTVFLNTHLLEEVEHVCDRAAVIDRGQTIASGTLAELVGTQASVRLQVSGLQAGWWDGLSGFGAWAVEDGWFVVTGIEEAKVPDLVRAIVELGGRIAAVVPEHKSLEDRFLELLGQS